MYMTCNFHVSMEGGEGGEVADVGENLQSFKESLYRKIATSFGSIDFGFSIFVLYILTIDNPKNFTCPIYSTFSTFRRTQKTGNIIVLFKGYNW